MATLELHRKSGRYRIRFRFGGKAFKRSLKTGDPREARAVCYRVDETIRLIERGRLVIGPEVADVASFIISDGKLADRPEIREVLTLEKLFAKYEGELPEGAKDPTTLATEKIHRQHLLRLLGKDRVVLQMTGATMQGYADKRMREKHHDRKISDQTIKKEIATFRFIWNWAVNLGYLSGNAPTRGLKYPKARDKLPFMTYEEIERIVKRGGLTARQEKDLWDCLFLAATQVEQVLDYVQALDIEPHIYPMFVFAAHTGARRSEILRSQIEDFDFESRLVLIREKKKCKSKSMTFRRVELSPRLAEAMGAWFANHPGGNLCIVEKKGKTFVPCVANHHLHRALRGHRWEKIRGFHVFRHSFVSILAAAGTDQRVIDEFTGHQTDEMRRRYRHLFPEQRRRAILAAFGSESGVTRIEENGAARPDTNPTPVREVSNAG